MFIRMKVLILGFTYTCTYLIDPSAGILFDCKGSDVGVFVCGPQKMRHEVAKICASGLADNLHFESISFNWWLNRIHLLSREGLTKKLLQKICVRVCVSNKWKECMVITGSPRLLCYFLNVPLWEKEFSEWVCSFHSPLHFLFFFFFYYLLNLFTIEKNIMYILDEVWSYPFVFLLLCKKMKRKVQIIVSYAVANI